MAGAVPSRYRADSPTVPEVENHNDCSILVVDDEESLSELVGNALSFAGFETCLLDNGSCIQTSPAVGYVVRESRN